MRAYTSLEQGKKLAEILPVESADMCYKCIEDDPYDIVCKPYSEWKEEYKGLLVIVDVNVIPCWSLAALLEIIPTEIFCGDYIINITEGLDNKWCITYDNIYNKNHSFYGLSSSADNLIDACHEIILKLHERKLL